MAARGRLFRAVVKLRREGGQNDWMVQGDRYDRELARRLIPRVVYGGRKGRRAFLRLWKMGVVPGEPVVKKYVVRIRGFELTEDVKRQLVAMRQDGGEVDT